MKEKQILIRPVVSEKSYTLMENGAYIFVVDVKSKKGEIKDAVERIFNVEVRKVNTMHRKGKGVRNRRTGVTHYKPNTKRAIVTLAPDHKIELFEEARS